MLIFLKRYQKCLKYLLITGYLLFPIKLLAIDFSFNPGIIEVQTFPGGVKSFTLSIQNHEKGEKGRFKIYVTDLVIGKDGTISYPEPGTSRWSCAKWISLSSSDISVEPGKVKNVTCQIRVPQGEVGGKYAVIMCEKKGNEMEEIEDNEARITSNWRIGCAVLLSVRGHNVKKNAEIFNIKVVPVSDGWLSSVFLENKGNIHISANGEVVIKDEKDRIICKDKLVTRKGETILPEGVCKYVSHLRRTLPMGTYTIKAILDYGGVKSAVKEMAFYSKGVASNLEVREDGTKKESIPFCMIFPPTLEMEVLPGRFFSRVLTLKNTRNEPIRVRPKIMDFDITPTGVVKYLNPGETSFSAANWFKLESLEEFIIPEEGEKRLKLSIKIPSDAEGGRYATFVLEAVTEDGLQSISEMPLLISVNYNIKKEIKIAKFKVATFKKQADELVIMCSIKIENTGNIHFNPKKYLLIYNPNGEASEPIPISINENILLPKGVQDIKFKLSPAKEIKDGWYHAELVVEYDKNEKITAREGFEIKKRSDDNLVGN